MEKELYFEDFHEGLRFTNGGYTISKEEAIGFASKYDPQFLHTDEEAARHSLWGALTVCGMHTAAVTMRLKIGTRLSHVSGGLVGLGMEHMKWPAPVFPGDTLRIVVTITGTRLSKSNPAKGLVYYKIETFNQHDVPVMKMQTAVLVPREQNQ